MRFSILLIILLFQFTSGFADSLAKEPIDLKDSHWHQWSDSNPDWIAPIEPFRIIGNIYYVGTQGIGAYLIAGQEGHMLLDGGLPQSSGQIAANIQHLGFKLNDVKLLLNSHAHFDHSGGLAGLKELTRAKMVSSKLDAHWLQSGYYPGSKRLDYASKPVEVDLLVSDGESISVGDIRLTAQVTAGHTPGCTSWMTDVVDSEETYSVLLFCGASVAGNKLVPEQYDGIVDDYRSTLKKIKTWKVDVFLSNHPFYFSMAAKREYQKKGDTLAFVDSTEFEHAVKKMTADFERQLIEQQKDSGKNGKD